MSLDWLWSAAALALAVDTISAAWESLDYETLLYFSTHLAIAILFLIRHRSVEKATTRRSYLVAGFSTIYVYFYNIELPAGGWLSSFGRALILIGSSLSLLSILSLGRCFGIFPALRGVRTEFTYGVVRHPIYASYILTDIGLLAVYQHPRNALLFFVAVTLFILRIHYEETLLQRLDQYRDYMAIVRFRLLPLVY